MRRLILILILTFSLQSWTKAEDISDFEIEGMSVGDSLLDHYSEKEIKKFSNYDHLPSDMKFRIADDSSLNSDQYDGLQFFYKPQDKKFIIHSIGGHIYCEDDDAKCKKILNDIKLDMSKLLSNKKFKKRTFKHFDDKSGKSIVTMYFIDFDNGGIDIKYTNWSKNVTWTDHVSVNINTREAINWMKNNYGAE